MLHEKLMSFALVFKTKTESKKKKKKGEMAEKAEIILSHRK